MYTKHIHKTSQEITSEKRKKVCTFLWVWKIKESKWFVYSRKNVMSHSLLTTVQYVENNKKAAREYWIVEVKSLQWYCHMKSEAKWTFATFLSSFFLNLSLNFKNIWKALLKIETKIRKKNSGAFNLNPKMKYRHSLFIRLFFPSPVREEHSNNSADEFVCVFFLSLSLALFCLAGFPFGFCTTIFSLL